MLAELVNSDADVAFLAGAILCVIAGVFALRQNAMVWALVAFAVALLCVGIMFSLDGST